MGNQSFARPVKARRRHPPPPRLPFAPRPGRRGLWWGSGQRRHPPPPRLPCGPRPGRRGLWRGSGQRRRPPSLRRKVCHVTMLFTHTSLHAPGAHLPVSGFFFQGRAGGRTRGYGVSTSQTAEGYVWPPRLDRALMSGGYVGMILSTFLSLRYLPSKIPKSCNLRRSRRCCCSWRPALRNKARCTRAACCASCCAARSPSGAPEENSLLLAPGPRNWAWSCPAVRPGAILHGQDGVRPDVRPPCRDPRNDRASGRGLLSSHGWSEPRWLHRRGPST